MQQHLDTCGICAELHHGLCSTSVSLASHFQDLVKSAPPAPSALPKLPARGRIRALSPWLLAAAGVLDAVGLGPLARRIEAAAMMQTFERLNLDGLLALWHPSASD